MVRLFHDNANSHIVVSKYQLSQLMFAQIVLGQSTISMWKTVFDFYSASPPMIPTGHFRQHLQTCENVNMLRNAESKIERNFEHILR